MAEKTEAAAPPDPVAPAVPAPGPAIRLLFDFRVLAALAAVGFGADWLLGFPVVQILLVVAAAVALVAAFWRRRR